MPALANPRWERFAQAIVYGANSKKDAYIDAGYKARDHSAEELGSRLLRKVEPIARRVHELLEEQKAAREIKDRFTRETLAKRMALASKIAEEDRNPSAIATNELGIAKLYGLVTDKFQVEKDDKDKPKDSNDIAIALLADVGIVSPDDATKEKALEAYDVMIATLEQIAAETLRKSRN